MKILTRDEYHSKMGKNKKIYGKEDCPFCFDYASIWEGRYWYLVRNISPYSGDKNHLMAVPFAHKKYSTDLSDEEFLELKKVQEEVKKYFGEENYFSCTRESMANRSIEHLHIHFIPGKLQGKFLRKMLEGQGFPIKEDLKI